MKGRIFEPFFTTKDVGQGLGLGLPICHQLMEGMGGSITLVSNPGQGARFTLDWPMPDRAAAGEIRHATTL
jgi:signal transduction histidine kinase